MATAADASQQYERAHHLTFTEVFGANVGGDQMLPDEVARALARGEARRIMDDAAALEAEAARVPPPQSQPRVLQYKKRTPPPLNLAMAGPLGTPQISPKLTQPNKGLTINAALANELQRRLNSPNGLQSGGPISPRTTSPIALSGYSDFRSRGGRLSSPPSRPASPRGSSPRGPSPIRITHLDLETEMRVETSAAATAIATSKMRFYILWAFSFCAIAGGASFNVLSPVSATIRRAYGWGDGYVTWCVRSSTNSPVEVLLLSFSLIDNIFYFPSLDLRATNAANIAFFVTLWPASRAVEIIGVRRLTVLCAATTVVASLLRLAPPESVESLLGAGGWKGVNAFAMVLTGIGAPWANFGGCLISELWFPRNERTVATAVASVAAFTGIALGFIIGPATVSLAGDKEGASAADAQHAMTQLFFVEAAVAVCAFVTVWLYFPDAPEMPPSPVAAFRALMAEERRARALAAKTVAKIELVALATGGGRRRRQPHSTAFVRVDSDSPGRLGTSDVELATISHFDDEEGGAHNAINEAPHFDGVLSLLVCRRCWGACCGRQGANSSELRRFWILALCAGFPVGVNQAWGSVLHLNVEWLMTQQEAGVLGFTMAMIGCLGAIVTGSLLDRCAGHLKAAAVVLLIAASISFGIFAIVHPLLNMGFIGHELALALTYATGIMGGLFSNCR
tara:strand:+ start:850 stop:2895 length:2046 start_codon:yes stop_codon:yes gene_type:complete